MKYFLPSNKFQIIFLGHLMSTAQVESVLVEHKSVAEAAVVAAPHVVKGECLYCFVTPKDGCKVNDYTFLGFGEHV